MTQTNAVLVLLELYYRELAFDGRCDEENGRQTTDKPFQKRVSWSLCQASRYAGPLSKLLTELFISFWLR